MSRDRVPAALLLLLLPAVGATTPLAVCAAAEGGAELEFQYSVPGPPAGTPTAHHCTLSTCSLTPVGGRVVTASRALLLLVVVRELPGP